MPDDRYPNPIVVPGKPIGRRVRHDPRSLLYQVVPDGTVATVLWERTIPVLDQGDVGSCTGNATVGLLGTVPNVASVPAGVTLNEAEALKIYSAAETIDGDGPYPPNDNGSSGVSAASAAKNAGLCSGYVHATSLAAAQTAIQKGPFMIGSDWYTSMDSPDANGLVTVSGTVRGGHEYECRGYDSQTDLWHLTNSWGTSFGVNGEFFYSSASFSKLLADQGDVTQLVPLSQPAPVPTPVPTPQPTPTPTPTPAPSNPLAALNAALWAELNAWAKMRHVGDNHDAAQAVIAWALNQNFTLDHEAEHSAN